MGILEIFGDKNKQNEVVNEQESFERTIIHTKDLSSDLEKLSKKYKIPLKKLDYRILSYKTFFSLSKKDGFTELTELNKDEILVEDNILDPHVTFSQELRVEVFKKNPKSKFPLSIAISGNKDLTTIRATIKAQESVSYFERLDSEILAELDKKKAKLGLMLGFMDENMRKGVKKLISIIRVNGGIKENVSFDICKGYDFIEGIKDRIIHHYKSGKEDDNLAMHGVKKGDLVLEYIKPKEGVNGRNCKGEILTVTAIELANKSPKISVGDEFLIKEDEDKILYIAKEKGYIHEGTGGRYEIKDEYVVKSVSVKTTGDINVGEDSDVSVTIKEQDAILDAVGPGVEIDTNEINIAGSVANNAKVKATILNIKGQTHQSSRVEAKELKVRLHKGYAEGDVVEIEILEGGVIVGDIVRVGQVSGGEIRAKEVYIDTVLSNSKISASHHIELNKIEGNGNIFTIDSLAQRDFHKKFDSVDEQISNLDHKIKTLPKELKQLKNKIQREKESINEINKNVAEMKRFGKTPPSSMVLKLKEHQERIKKYNSLLKELKDAKISRVSLQEELMELNSSVLNAKVVNKSTWREFNEVKFKLTEPPIEVSFLPKEGEIIKALSLKTTEEGDYHIKREG